MQTFLTSPSFEESADALDNKRLGKQRVENLQIVKALMIPSYGWQNHPAILMWKGYELALLNYQDAIVAEWCYTRGFQDTCYEKTEQIFDYYSGGYQGDAVSPPWLGNPDFHRSHQSSLIRKDRFFYGPQFPGVPDDLPYIWPTHTKE